MCVWPADLEKALAIKSDKPVDFDKLDWEERDELMKSYVPSRFRMTSESDSAGSLRWVGHEVGQKAIWMYFEIEADAAPKTWAIENRILFECNEDQLNQHDIQIGDQRISIESTEDNAALKIASSEQTPRSRNFPAKSEW